MKLFSCQGWQEKLANVSFKYFTLKRQRLFLDAGNIEVLNSTGKKTTAQNTMIDWNCSHVPGTKTDIFNRSFLCLWLKYLSNMFSVIIILKK